MLIPVKHQSVSVDHSISYGRLRSMLLPDVNSAWASVPPYASVRIRLLLSLCLFLVFMCKQALPAHAWPEGGSVISCGRQAGNNWWGVVEEKQAVNTLPYDNSKRQPASRVPRQKRRGKKWIAKPQHPTPHPQNSKFVQKGLCSVRPESRSVVFSQAESGEHKRGTLVSPHCHLLRSSVLLQRLRNMEIIELW